MEHIKRDIILLKLIKHMLDNGSWCGETHIQKTTFFLQELFILPLGFKFILYKHGAYSFDLHDCIIEMLADNFLGIQVNQPDYGPSLVPTSFNHLVENALNQRFNDYDAQIAFCAKEIGTKNVYQLERLSTALLMMQRLGDDKIQDEESIAKNICVVKKHVSQEEAAQAVRDLKNILERIPSLH